MIVKLFMTDFKVYLLKIRKETASQKADSFLKEKKLKRKNLII